MVTTMWETHPLVGAAVWSRQTESIISRLIHERPPEDAWTRQQADRVGALFVGWDLWSCWFLRPTGEVVLVNEELMVAADVSVTDPGDRLRALVWAATKYPELAALLPLREPDAPECPWTANPRFHDANEVRCPICFGLGWVPQLWR